MDVEVLMRQIQEAQGRLCGMLNEVEARPVKIHQALEAVFAELSATFEALHVTAARLHDQQQDQLASQQASESERQHYQDLFEFAPDGYLVTDEQGVIREANCAAATLLNIDRQLMAGLPLQRFVAKDALAALLEQLQSVRNVQSGTIQEWEIRLQPRDKEPCDFRVRVAPITDRSQRVVGMRWLLRGQTACKQTLEHAWLDAILQHMPAGIIIVEVPSSRVLFSNAQAEAILQGPLPAGTLFEDYAYTKLHPDGRRYNLMEWPLTRTFWTDAVVLDQEIDIAPSDGVPAIIRVSTAPIHDQRGKTVAAVASFHDITEQRRSERNIQDSEAKLRAILDSANQSITLLAPNYTIQSFNRIAAEGARAVFGNEMAIGASMLDYLLPEHIGEFKQHFREALQGTPITIEKPVREQVSADWWEFHYAPIRLSSGEITGITFTARVITVRKHAEERLRESEERLRCALEAGQMGHWDWNIRTGDIAWSPEHNRMLGLPIDQAHGSYEQFMEQVHPDDRDQIAEALTRLQVERCPFKAEFRVIWPDGSIHWIAGNANGYDHGGRIVRMVGVIRDITERKQAEQALSNAHLQARAILESISDAFYAVDDQWRFSYVNHKAEQLLGQSREQLLRKNIWEAFPAAMLSDAYTYHQQAMTERQMVEFEMLSPVFSSWIEGRIYPSQQGISVYFHDISQRKRTEVGLRLLAQASTLLSASLDYETTLAQVAQLAVPALADLCVVTTQEADPESRRIEIAVTEATPAEHVAAIKKLADDGWSRLMAQAVRREEPMLFPDLPRAFFEMAEPNPEHQRLMEALDLQSLMIIPLQVREHTLGVLIIGATSRRQAYDQTDLAFASDLAYRIALAVDNARLYRDAQAAIIARDTFLSIASHELKTPLTAMIGYAYLLQHAPTEGMEATARTRQAVDVIARQTQRLNSLIEELLDLSRIQRGQWEVLLQPLDILPVIERAVEEARLTTTNHRIHWMPSDAELIINGDEGKLEQVIQNLLNNAVKYSSRGGQISVAVKSDDHAVQISVTDQGIGIPQAAQERLWEPFYRAANASKQSSGFGIGLFIVHQIVQRHGGTITVQSKEYEGSTFTVTLPLLAGAD